MPSLLPRVHKHFTTVLTPAQIQAVLAETISSGFALYTRQPYYGRHSAYDFSARRVYSRLKQSSLGVTVDGAFRAADAGAHVTLTIRPHPAVMFAALVLGVLLLGYLVIGLRELLVSREPALVVSGLFPLLIIVLPLLWLFHQAAGAAQRFWMHALQLHEIG